MRPFEMVCTSCIEKSNKEKKPYKGLVNWHIEPIKPGLTMVYFKCFTCGSSYVWNVDIRNPAVRDEPKTKKEFIQRRKIEKERPKN